MKLAARALLVGVTASFIGMVFAQSAQAQLVNLRLGTSNDMMLWEPEGTYTKVTTGSVLVPTTQVIQHPVTLETNNCVSTPVVIEDQCATPSVIEHPAVFERTAPVLIQEHRRPLIDLELF